MVIRVAAKVKFFFSVYFRFKITEKFEYFFACLCKAVIISIFYNVLWSDIYVLTFRKDVLPSVIRRELVILTLTGRENLKLSYKDNFPKGRLFLSSPSTRFRIAETLRLEVFAVVRLHFRILFSKMGENNKSSEKAAEILLLKV